MACTVKLVKSHSRKPCQLNVNFGCEGSSMWIGVGCRGEFNCQGHDITCGTAGLIFSGDPPRHYCTCALMQRGGLYLKSPSAQPVMELPEGLLRSPPRLTEAKLGSPRFQPRDTNESLMSTFTMWNVLDAIMATAMPNYAWQTGYVRELQLRRMVQLAQLPGISTYCEIGFNGGHSAAAMLYANPRLTIHAFDLMMWEYSNATSALLRTTFGRRFRMHRGDSTVTVPAWTRSHPGGCDLAFVDGDHSVSGAMVDMLKDRKSVV